MSIPQKPRTKAVARDVAQKKKTGNTRSGIVEWKGKAKKMDEKKSRSSDRKKGSQSTTLQFDLQCNCGNQSGVKFEGIIPGEQTNAGKVRIC